jgi:5-methylthioadenosine/S-adenosylhomocysteine deaminase
MRHVDSLIHAGWVVPVEAGPAVLPDHSIAVQDGRIVAVLPTAESRLRYDARENWEMQGHVIIPGLVNLHTHAAMSLMRGVADDLPLMTWLHDHIWPAEMALVGPDFVRDGTRLACAEMIRGGITCFQDMYFFPDAAAEAVLDSGMRAVLGMIVIEFPSAYAGDAAGYLHRGMEIRDRFRAEPRLSFSLAPHAPYTIGDATFGQVLTYAEQLEVPVHTHIHETDDEILRGREKDGVRPLARLQGLGLLGPGLIGAHMVHLTDDEIASYARAGSHVAHCPSSNLKLASGFAPIAKLVEAGVNVGLGTDGAASNNRLDLFEEMRLAALLAKAVAGRADAVPARKALEMATLGGARALGVADRLGSIAPGKQADLTAIDFSALALQPVYDVVSQIVYAAGREHVTHVWVDGELILKDRVLTRMDEAEVVAAAATWQPKIAAVQVKSA